jgi:hypothetical protein
VVVVSGRRAIASIATPQAQCEVRYTGFKGRARLHFAPLVFVLATILTLNLARGRGYHRPRDPQHGAAATDAGSNHQS